MWQARWGMGEVQIFIVMDLFIVGQKNTSFTNHLLSSTSVLQNQQNSAHSNNNTMKQVLNLDK
uniref:Uncharacterized protein n=1 Tax=Manihot esculenta TaxID=3983 RepID=A0A2C9VXQ7_MANES